MLTFKENKGQGLVEYALILVLVAVVVIVILALLGPAIGNVFSTVINDI
jgi:pilus assembly protein Flp/PilA